MTERIEQRPFGPTRDGTPATRFTLRNRGLLACELCDYGATLVAMHVPDREGRLADVVLGFDQVAGYESAANQYFGCTTGRVANRIAGGRFTLDGVSHSLAVNDPPNHLHGGTTRSLDKLLWRARTSAGPDSASVVFTCTSRDGEEGYPGNVEFTVTYVLDDADELRIEFVATTDRATPVNLTNHAYWNLAGAGSGSVLGHELTLNARQYTPVDATLIPDGTLRPVAGTPLDFTRPTPLGARIEPLLEAPTRGYDHNFVLAGAGEGRAPGAPAFAARLRDPASGRTLELVTTQPGIQVYSGNHLHGQVGKGGRRYARHGAVCLELQGFPDAPNHPNFPSVVLRPGETYRQVIVHRFTAR